MILAKKGSHTAAETTVHTIKAKATVATTVKTTVRIAVPTVDQNEVTLQTFNVFKLEKKQMKLPKEQAVHKCSIPSQPLTSLVASLKIVSSLDKIRMVISSCFLKLKGVVPLIYRIMNFQFQLWISPKQAYFTVIINDTLTSFMCIF